MGHLRVEHPELFSVDSVFYVGNDPQIHTAPNTHANDVSKAPMSAVMDRDGIVPVPKPGGARSTPASTTASPPTYNKEDLQNKLKEAVVEIETALARVEQEYAGRTDLASESMLEERWRRILRQYYTISMDVATVYYLDALLDTFNKTKREAVAAINLFKILDGVKNPENSVVNDEYSQLVPVRKNDVSLDEMADAMDALLMASSMTTYVDALGKVTYLGACATDTSKDYFKTKWMKMIPSKTTNQTRKSLQRVFDAVYTSPGLKSTFEDVVCQVIYHNSDSKPFLSTLAKESISNRKSQKVPALFNYLREMKKLSSIVERYSPDGIKGDIESLMESEIKDVLAVEDVTAIIGIGRQVWNIEYRVSDKVCRTLMDSLQEEMSTLTQIPIHNDILLSLLENAAAVALKIKQILKNDHSLAHAALRMYPDFENKAVEFLRRFKHLNPYLENGATYVNTLKRCFTNDHLLPSILGIDGYNKVMASTKLQLEKDKKGRFYVSDSQRWFQYTSIEILEREGLVWKDASGNYTLSMNPIRSLEKAKQQMMAPTSIYHTWSKLAADEQISLIRQLVKVSHLNQVSVSTYSIYGNRQYADISPMESAEKVLGTFLSTYEPIFMQRVIDVRGSGDAQNILKWNNIPAEMEAIAEISEYSDTSKEIYMSMYKKMKDWTDADIKKTGSKAMQDWLERIPTFSKTLIGQKRTKSRNFTKQMKLVFTAAIAIAQSEKVNAIDLNERMETGSVVSSIAIPSALNEREVRVAAAKEGFARAAKEKQNQLVRNETLDSKVYQSIQDEAFGIASSIYVQRMNVIREMSTLGSDIDFEQQPADWKALLRTYIDEVAAPNTISDFMLRNEQLKGSDHSALDIYKSFKVPNSEVSLNAVEVEYASSADALADALVNASITFQEADVQLLKNPKLEAILQQVWEGLQAYIVGSSDKLQFTDALRSTGMMQEFQKAYPIIYDEVELVIQNEMTKFPDSFHKENAEGFAKLRSRALRAWNAVVPQPRGFIEYVKTLSPPDARTKAFDIYTGNVNGDFSMTARTLDTVKSEIDIVLQSPERASFAVYTSLFEQREALLQRIESPYYSQIDLIHELDISTAARTAASGADQSWSENAANDVRVLKRMNANGMFTDSVAKEISTVVERYDKLATFVEQNEKAIKPKTMESPYSVLAVTAPNTPRPDDAATGFLYDVYTSDDPNNVLDAFVRNTHRDEIVTDIINSIRTFINDGKVTEFVTMTQSLHKSGKLEEISDAYPIIYSEVQSYVEEHTAEVEDSALWRARALRAWNVEVELPDAVVESLIVDIEKSIEENRPETTKFSIAARFNNLIRVAKDRFDTKMRDLSDNLHIMAMDFDEIATTVNKEIATIVKGGVTRTDVFPVTGDWPVASEEVESLRADLDTLSVVRAEFQCAESPFYGQKDLEQQSSSNANTRVDATCNKVFNVALANKALQQLTPRGLTQSLHAVLLAMQWCKDTPGEKAVAFKKEHDALVAGLPKDIQNFHDTVTDYKLLQRTLDDIKRVCEGDSEASLYVTLPAFSGSKLWSSIIKPEDYGVEAILQIKKDDLQKKLPKSDTIIFSYKQYDFVRQATDLIVLDTVHERALVALEVVQNLSLEDVKINAHESEELAPDDKLAFEDVVINYQGRINLSAQTGDLIGVSVNAAHLLAVLGQRDDAENVRQVLNNLQVQTDKKTRAKEKANAEEDAKMEEEKRKQAEADAKTEEEKRKQEKVEADVKEKAKLEAQEKAVKLSAFRQRNDDARKNLPFKKPQLDLYSDLNLAPTAPSTPYSEVATAMDFLTDMNSDDMTNQLRTFETNERQEEIVNEIVNDIKTFISGGKMSGIIELTQALHKDNKLQTVSDAYPIISRDIQTYVQEHIQNNPDDAALWRARALRAWNVETGLPDKVVEDAITDLEKETSVPALKIRLKNLAVVAKDTLVQGLNALKEKLPIMLRDFDEIAVFDSDLNPRHQDTSGSDGIALEVENLRADLDVLYVSRAEFDCAESPLYGQKDLAFKSMTKVIDRIDRVYAEVLNIQQANDLFERLKQFETTPTLRASLLKMTWCKELHDAKKFKAEYDSLVDKLPAAVHEFYQTIIDYVEWEKIFEHLSDIWRGGSPVTLVETLSKFSASKLSNVATMNDTIREVVLAHKDDIQTKLTNIGKGFSMKKYDIISDINKWTLVDAVKKNVSIALKDVRQGSNASAIDTVQDANDSATDRAVLIMRKVNDAARMGHMKEVFDNATQLIGHLKQTMADVTDLEAPLEELRREANSRLRVSGAVQIWKARKIAEVKRQERKTAEAARLVKEQADAVEAARLAKEQADAVEAARLAKEQADVVEANRRRAHEVVSGAVQIWRARKIAETKRQERKEKEDAYAAALAAAAVAAAAAAAAAASNKKPLVVTGPFADVYAKGRPTQNFLVALRFYLGTCPELKGVTMLMAIRVLDAFLLPWASPSASDDEWKVWQFPMIDSDQFTDVTALENLVRELLPQCADYALRLVLPHAKDECERYAILNAHANVRIACERTSSAETVTVDLPTVPKTGTPVEASVAVDLSFPDAFKYAHEHQRRVMNTALTVVGARDRVGGKGNERDLLLALAETAIIMSGVEYDNDAIADVRTYLQQGFEPPSASFSIPRPAFPDGKEGDRFKALWRETHYRRYLCACDDDDSENSSGCSASVGSSFDSFDSADRDYEENCNCPEPKEVIGPHKLGAIPTETLKKQFAASGDEKKMAILSLDFFKQVHSEFGRTAAEAARRIECDHTPFEEARGLAEVAVRTSLLSLSLLSMSPLNYSGNWRTWATTRVLTSTGGAFFEEVEVHVTDEIKVFDVDMRVPLLPFAADALYVRRWSKLRLARHDEADEDAANAEYMLASAARLVKSKPEYLNIW